MGSENDQMLILCFSYCAYSYNQYISQEMHLIKYNSWQVSNFYMFWHWDAIPRQSSRTTEYKSNMLN